MIHSAFHAYLLIMIACISSVSKLKNIFYLLLFVLKMMVLDALFAIAGPSKLRWVVKGG